MGKHLKPISLTRVVYAALFQKYGVRLGQVELKGRYLAGDTDLCTTSRGQRERRMLYFSDEGKQEQLEQVKISTD